MFLSKLVAKAREAVGRFLHPLRTMMTEEELFTLDDLLVPDPEKPGRYTRASVIEAACYMMERGFVVKAGDNVGGDSLSATVDEQMVEDAKRLFTLRKKLPGATVENLIPVAVCEALNGIMSAHRAAARVAGKSTVRAKIPLTQIHERVKPNCGKSGCRRPSSDATTPY
jgi:hypothetical protein